MSDLDLDAIEKAVRERTFGQEQQLALVARCRKAEVDLNRAVSVIDRLLGGKLDPNMPYAQWASEAWELCFTGNSFEGWPQNSKEKLRVLAERLVSERVDIAGSAAASVIADGQKRIAELEEVLRDVLPGSGNRHGIFDRVRALLGKGR
ncbi:MAG: hypothetical protein ACE5M4_09125 [Anaerolineales bacterium]